MKKLFIILAVFMFLGVNIYYLTDKPKVRLPLLKTEEVTMLELQKPPGTMKSNTVDKAKIAVVVRGFNTARIARNSFGSNPDRVLILRLADGRLINIWPSNTQQVRIGILEAGKTSQVSANSPELARYLANPPELK